MLANQALSLDIAFGICDESVLIKNKMNQPISEWDYIMITFVVIELDIFHKEQGKR